MGITIITNNHWGILLGLFKSANQQVNIISPFITDTPSELLFNALKNNLDMQCSIITRFYRADFISGVSQLSALHSLVRAGAEVYVTCPHISRRGNVGNCLKVSVHILLASGC